ncbi:glycoside hydrolase family 78 protein [Tessaracoccus terricola]
MFAATGVNAHFITSRRPCGAAEDPALYVRREFAVADGLRRATLRSTAVGLVEVHLNGQRVGSEVLAPGWSSYRHRLVVSTHDVTDLVTDGANAIGAIVGQGWAVGRIGWEGKSHHWSEQPAVLLQLELDYGDRTEVIGTDESFLTGTGGVRANSIYDGETYDATLEQPGWCRPGTTGGEWTPAVRFDWDHDALARPTTAPITRTEEISPREIVDKGDGRFVVDFGQVLTGWLRLTVRGEQPGHRITLRHAELLIDGELDLRTLRTAKATDTFVVGGPEAATFEPRFTFHGFRYAEVAGLSSGLEPDDVLAVVVHSGMRRAGWFESSSPELDQLHENAVWSMRGNFVGVPTDCPQRDERMGWTGDINAFAPTAVLLHDVRDFLSTWLLDVRTEQAASGFVPWVVPDVSSAPSSPTALWSDVAVNLPMVLHAEYGDVAILEQSYHSMATFTRSVAELLDYEGLWSTGFQFGDWLDPDAPQDNPAGGKTDRHLVATAFFARTAQQMAEAAKLLGRDDDAEEFLALATRVRDAFRREHVTASGRVTGESATAYALAICFDLLDADQVAKAGQRLAALTREAGNTISTGFAGTPFMLPALERARQLETAWELLMEPRCPSFLYPISMGATTIWERWDAITPDGELNDHGMTSLNHYALGSVVAWLYGTVAGLAATEAGWRRIRVAPKPGGGLTHARASHDTVLGRAEAGWRIEAGRITVDAVIPEGAEADVVLPLSPEPSVTVGPGNHTWTYDLPADHDVRPEFTMDTPLSELAADSKTWQALTAVFATHLPGIPIDGNDPQARSISLSTMLDFVPGATDAFRSDLENTLINNS